MGPLGVVLAVAQPSEAITVALLGVPMPIALTRLTAAGPRGIAEAAWLAPLTLFTPGPVCKEPGTSGREETSTANQPLHWTYNVKPGARWKDSGVWFVSVQI